MSELTAHFTADFSKFRNAVDQATTKLRGFEKGASKVNASLARVGDAFSGRRMLQEATLAVKVIEDMGGATVLTANEQKKLNAQLTEAIEKYKALGKVAPKGMRELAQATSQTQGVFSRLSTALGPLGTALAGVFSVQALMRFNNEITELASTMSNLSTQTGIGVEDLQALRYAVAGADIPIEELGRAILSMSKRVAGDDTSAAAALAKLGINVQRFKQLNAHDQFIQIAEAAKKLEDPIVELSELFGEKLARSILKLANDDLPALEREAYATGAVIDKELIARADEWGDAWDRQIIRVKAALAGFFLGRSLAEERMATEVKGALDDIQNPDKLDTTVADQLQANIDKATKQLKEAGSNFLATQRQQTTDGIRLTEALASAYESSMTRIVQAQIDATKRAQEQAKQLRDTLVWLRDEIDDVANRIEAAWDRAFDADQLQWFRNEMRDFQAYVDSVADEIYVEITNAAEGAKNEIEGIDAYFESRGEEIARDRAKTFSGAFIDNLKDLRREVPRIITDAFTGGGGLKGALKAIAVQLANAFIEPFIDTLIKAFASAAFKRAIANAAAGSTGAAVPVGTTGTGGGGGGGGAAALWGPGLTKFATSPLGGAIFGAAAGGAVGYGVGRKTGSKTWGALSGAGTGATVGFMLGGPIGGVIGAGVGFVGGLIGGSQGAAIKANDARDQFLAQFGPAGTGPGSGFRRLADQLYRRNGNEALFTALQNARTPDAVKRAADAIVANLSGGASGGPARGVVQPAALYNPRGQGQAWATPTAAPVSTVNISINAIDRASFDQAWRDHIVPRLRLELLTNQMGTLTALNRVVA